MWMVQKARFHLRHLQRLSLIKPKNVSEFTAAVIQELSDRNKEFLICPEIAILPYKYTDQRNTSPTRYIR